MTRDLTRRSLLAATAGLLASGPLGARSSKIGHRRLMQGPMVGPAGESSIVLWGRASGPYPVAVEYDDNPLFTGSRVSQAVLPDVDDDFAFTIRIEGLSPATTYYYRMIVDGKSDRYLAGQSPFETKTAPAASHAGSIRIAFGSCARFQAYPRQEIWHAIAAKSPDIFLWLGDNVYVDSLHAGIFADEYKRQRDVKEFQPFQRQVPQLAIWDDHDYGLNNSDQSNPVKGLALDMFKRFWPNPAFGTDAAPGCYFSYQYGGVDLFMLDGRTYRAPNADEDTPEKSLLGPVQLAWLKQALRESRAPFKVLACGSGWSSAKGPGGDSWAAFLNERNALFDFIRDESIEGVVLISGDTHVAELNCIPRADQGGYDLYDLVSSPLAQSPGNGWLERRPEIRIRPVYFGGPNFGQLTIDLHGEPTLYFDVYDVYGRPAWDRFSITAAKLKNGVSSWRDTIDAVSLERHRNSVEKGYFYRP